MRIRIAALAALGLASPAPLPAQETPIAVSARVDVAVRTVSVVITDRSGKPLAAPPSPETIEVLEDGATCEVLGIEPVGEGAPAPASAKAGTTPPAPAPERASPARRQRRQVLYVDATLLRVHSVKETADAFAAQAEHLLALGPLEIVVADPRVATFLAPTRDAAVLRAALAKLARLPGRDRVANLRKDARDLAIAQRRMATFSGRGEPSPLASSRSAAREEASLVAGALSRLARWAVSSPRREEGILYLASDGFEIDIAAGEPDEEMQRTLRSETVPGLLADVREAQRALLAGGWTTISFAVNALSSGFADAAEYASGRGIADPNSSTGLPGGLDHGLDGLRTFADATGGEVLVAAGQLEREVSLLGAAFLVTFRMTHAPDGRLHDLHVVSAVPDVRVRAVSAIPAGTTTSLSTARVLDVLEGGAAAGPLGVSLTFSNAAKEDRKRRRAELHVAVDVGRVAPLLAKVGRGRIRVSVAVEVPGAPPFVTHDEKDLPDPAPKGWVYDAPIVWPSAAKRISVVAEELATGSVGSATADLSAVR